MTDLFSRVALAATLGCLLISIQPMLAQGSLTPSGPPGPTMLTLSQIEPRTPVDATHTPGYVIAEFAITNSGSYYLTANIAGVSDLNGIEIQANNVVLDLNGFSLTNDSTAAGIEVDDDYTNITVRNGCVSGWAIGVFYGGENGTLENLKVTGNSQVGIEVGGKTGMVHDCFVSDNRFLGIEIGGNFWCVFNNICAGNDTENDSGDGGIAIVGSSNRIEANNVFGTTSEGDGIVLETGSMNLIFRNYVIGFGTNDYSLNGNAGQVVGPIITTTSSGTVTNTNPWANFGF